MEACLGKTESTDFEANPEETEFETEHEEVHKEESTMKTITVLKKMH
jgi:hypothetical protein